MENLTKYWKWIAAGIILILLFFWQGCDHVSSFFSKKSEQGIRVQKDEAVSLDNPLQDNQNTALENAMAPVVASLNEIQKSISSIATSGKKDTTIVICNCCPEKKVSKDSRVRVRTESKPRAKKDGLRYSHSESSSETVTTSESKHSYSDNCNCWICTEIRKPSGCSNCGTKTVASNCDGDC